MFGIKLPGFLNPLTPFKQAFALVGMVAKNGKAVVETPFKMAATQLDIYKDVLTLDFKSAAKNQAKLLTQPARTGLEILGNGGDFAKTSIKNLV